MSGERIPPRIPWPPRPIPTSPPRAAPKSVAPEPSAPISTRFSMKVGITVFGTPSYFNVDAAVSEFQSFIQANSKLDLQIIMNKYPPLALDEYHPIPEAKGFSFVDPWYVHPETLAKITIKCRRTNCDL